MSLLERSIETLDNVSNPSHLQVLDLKYLTFIFFSSVFHTHPLRQPQQERVFSTLNSALLQILALLSNIAFPSLRPLHPTCFSLSIVRTSDARKAAFSVRQAKSPQVPDGRSSASVCKEPEYAHDELLVGNQSYGTILREERSVLSGKMAV